MVLLVPPTLLCGCFLGILAKSLGSVLPLKRNMGNMTRARCPPSWKFMYADVFKLQPNEIDKETLYQIVEGKYPGKG